MARNGTWLMAVALLAARAGAGDEILERWEKPKRETLELPGAWPNQVVEELTERFGVPVELDPVDVKRADFALKDATFFEALDSFAALHRLGVLLQSDDGALAVRLVRAERATPVVYLGPTRLSLQGVTVVRVRELGAGREDDVPVASYADPGTPGMRLRMHWLAGPGLEEVRITQWKVSAEDDQGKRLTGIEEPWEESTLPNRDVSLALTPPTRGARTLRKVEGTASVVLPLERGKVEFAATEAGQTKRLGGARVKLQQVDAKEKSVSFSLKGRPCPGIKSDIDMDVASEVWHGSSGANAVRVVAYDAEGTEIPRGSGTHMSSDWLGRRTWTIEFEAVPSRIVLEALVRGEQREIPFSFTDIPLPE